VKKGRNSLLFRFVSFRFTPQLGSSQPHKRSCPPDPPPPAPRQSMHTPTTAPPAPPLSLLSNKPCGPRVASLCAVSFRISSREKLKHCVPNRGFLDTRSLPFSTTKLKLQPVERFCLSTCEKREKLSSFFRFTSFHFAAQLGSSQPPSLSQPPHPPPPPPRTNPSPSLSPSPKPTPSIPQQHALQNVRPQWIIQRLCRGNPQEGAHSGAEGVGSSTLRRRDAAATVV
jgi:hypothetical protein